LKAAGHRVVVLEPKDRMRYGHRLWADVNTGMLLKAKTFDENNELLEQFAFTQLQIGGDIDHDKLKSRYSRSRKWHIEDSGVIRANLAESGWTLRSRPPGFRTVTELIRTLGGTRGVGHIVLSDGLAAVSVFIEPAESKHPASQPGLVRQGAINVYMRQVSGYWVTVVGEAPADRNDHDLCPAFAFIGCNAVAPIRYPGVARGVVGGERHHDVFAGFNVVRRLDQAIADHH